MLMRSNAGPDDIRVSLGLGHTGTRLGVAEVHTPRSFRSALIEDANNRYEGFDREWFYAFANRPGRLVRIRRELLAVRLLTAILEEKRDRDEQVLRAPLYERPVIREYWAWQRQAHLDRGVPSFDLTGLVSRPDFAVREAENTRDFERVLLARETTYDGYDREWFYAFCHPFAKVCKVSRQRLGGGPLKDLLEQKQKAGEVDRQAPPGRFPVVREHRLWLRRAQPDPGAPLR
jgi:hypothetical protein